MPEDDKDIAPVKVDDIPASAIGSEQNNAPKIDKSPEDVLVDLFLQDKEDKGEEDDAPAIDNKGVEGDIEEETPPAGSEDEHKSKGEYESKLAEVAQQRAEIEHLKVSTEQMLLQKHQEASDIVIKLAENIKAQEGHIDWDKLAEEDPVAFNKERLKQDKRLEQLRVADAERQKLADSYQQTQKANYAEYVKKQYNALVEKMPELKDTKVASAAQANLNKYMLGSGFAPHEVDSLVDHRVWIAMEKARRYDELKAKGEMKAKSTRVAQLPRVSKPGAAKPTSGDRSDNLSQAKGRLAQTGDVADYATLIAQMM